MKLLYHSPSHEGGLTEYAVHQARALTAIEGLELIWQAPENVVAPEGARLLPALPTPNISPGRPRWKRAWDFITWILTTNHALDRAISETRPDVVFLPEWSEYLSPLWAWRFRRWRRRGVRFGGLIHDPIRNFERGGRFWHRLSLRHAYSFLDVAFVHESVELGTAGATVPPTVVVPHGPYPVPDGDTSRTELRQALGVPKEARVLLSFGHIRDGKCLDAVLQAMGACPETHLIVAGREQSAGQRPASYYQALAKELGVADRCHWFVGYIPNDEVWRYFRAADWLLLLYSRDFHSMSGVLNVNVQFRLPVIASAGGGPLLRSVADYRLGQVLDEATPENLTKALAASPMEAPRWEDYLRDHSWETNAQRVVNALRSAGR